MNEENKSEVVMTGNNSNIDYNDVGANTTFWLQTATHERQRQIEMRNKCINPLAEYKDRLSKGVK